MANHLVHGRPRDEEEAGAVVAVVVVVAGEGDNRDLEEWREDRPGEGEEDGNDSNVWVERWWSPSLLQQKD